MWLTVIDAHLSSYITCTVHWLVYLMVHVFLHGSVSGFYVLFMLCLPTSQGERFMGLCRWFSRLTLNHFSLTSRWNGKVVWVQIVFIFSLSQLFLALWWWIAVSWDKNACGKVLSWAVFCCFFHLSHFLSRSTDLSWQNGTKHIFCHIWFAIESKENGNFFRPQLCCSIASKLPMGNLSWFHIETKQIKGTLKSVLRARIHVSKERSCSSAFVLPFLSRHFLSTLSSNFGGGFF